MGSSWCNSKKEDTIRELIKNPSKLYEGNSWINKKHVQNLIDEYNHYRLKYRKSVNNEANSDSELQVNLKLENITYEDLYIGNHFMFKELYIKEGNKSKNISKLLSRKKKWDQMANIDPSKNAYDFK